MNILLTRHGQTDWNLQKKVQGKADISLNETGIEQAKKTKEKLDDEKIDLILCSPLKRAMETAEIINSNRKIPIIIEDSLSERDFGEFEGKNSSDFDFEGFWSYRKNLQYEKAENIRNFFDRVYRCMDKIKEKYKDKNVLLVAHGGISIPVECYFKGIPNQETLLNLALGNCEVAKYEVKEHENNLKNTELEL